MTNINSLKALNDWKLLHGSHDFPGPEGGTCINEAAIVAAGFPYRAVGSSKDLPECFCPIIGEFLIAINDHVRDYDRQLLKKYVLKLAGSKTTPFYSRIRLETLSNALDWKWYDKSDKFDASPSFVSYRFIMKNYNDSGLQVTLDMVDRLFEIGPRMYDEVDMEVAIQRMESIKVKALERV